MARLREVPATVAVVVATLAILAYVVSTPANFLFALVTPAALLVVAYVVDTGTGPRLDDMRNQEAAMLLAALVAVLLSVAAFAVGAGPLFGAAGSLSVLAVALVVANWRQRRELRS